MKNVGGLIACSLSIVTSAGFAANPAVPGYIAIERGPHHTVWSRIVADTNSNGSVFLRTSSFTELGNGLNHLENSEWTESEPQIVVTTNGAVGMGAQHTVAFAANLNTRGAIQVRTPEGGWLKSHVLGIAYYDSNLKTNVLIGQIKDSIGEVVSTNQVIYPDAFSGVVADVR